MWKKLTIILLLLSLLPLPVLSARVSAQGSLSVWNSLSTDDGGVISDAANRFQTSSGTAVELQTVATSRLLDQARTVTQSGAAVPDVVITDNQTADPLITAQFLASMGSSGFFLQDLLNNLPEMLKERCGNTPVETCLWPQGAAGMPIITPDQNTINHTLDWLCVSTDWLPSCKSGSPLAGVPVSWNFTILLFNTQWLSQNNLSLPTTVDTAQQIRSQYGLNITKAQRGDVPMAGSLSPDTIYQVDSAMLVQYPAEVMASLASFYQAGYTALVTVNIDSAYLSAKTPNADLAKKFAVFLGGDPDTKVNLLKSSQRLPAFDSREVSKQGIKSDESLITLQALTLLVTYAGMAY